MPWGRTAGTWEMKLHDPLGWWFSLLGRKGQWVRIRTQKQTDWYQVVALIVPI